MNIQMMKRTSDESLNGNMSFPQVVGELASIGVESYHVDLVQNLKTFYMPNGEFYSHKFDFEGREISKDFNSHEVKFAISKIQAKKISYKDFLHLIMKAGTAGYSVFINGKKAIYLGRDGDIHVENFPTSN